MASNQAQPTAVSVPDDLESPRSKLVYLYVSIHGPATTTELSTNLELTTGTVLPVLRSLLDQGHLEKTSSGYRLAR